MKNKERYSTIALISVLTLLFIGAVSSLETGETSETCRENDTIKVIYGKWNCTGLTIPTIPKGIGNISMISPNGSIYKCGVNNTGSFSCNQ